jgi:bifunctional UDP-N-acetylglucosamine pyrophosphorylase / glucosamine-1-phosphate N-acetyltransferase
METAHGGGGTISSPAMSRRDSEIPLLFAALPDAFAERFDAAAPWTLLGELLDEVLAALPSSDLRGQLSPEVHLVGDRIVISAGARIHPGVVIEGPVFIGEEAEVRPGAYIRGGVWIGEKCVVGANTEIKRAILLRRAKAPHLNYVGDSILGADVNLGAGTILSNFRHDGGVIVIPAHGRRIDTGRRKLGAILGDGVLTGCNSVLHPGVVVGRETQIYPGVQLRPGIYPEKSVVKLRQEIEIVSLSPSS